MFSSTSLVFKLYCKQGNENLEDVKPHFTAKHKVIPFPKAKKQISSGNITFHKRIFKSSRTT